MASMKINQSAIQGIRDYYNQNVFSPGEEKEFRENLLKGRKRMARRQKAISIFQRYDVITMNEDIPKEKLAKLRKACGKRFLEGKYEILDETVDDMDDDSFFGNAQAEKEEREEFINDENSSPVAKTPSPEPPEKIADEDSLEGIIIEQVNNRRIIEQPPPPPIIVENLPPVLKTPSPEPSRKIAHKHGNVGPLEEVIDRRAKSMPYMLCIQSEHIQQYLAFLTAETSVARFLRYDYCKKISDRYLLAVVCIYFARTGVAFTPDAFFKFLYLANETHEDDEESRYNIMATVLGENWREGANQFLNERLAYWHLLNFETIVARETLEELFTVEPQHPIWSRARKGIHSGTIPRWYILEPTLSYSPPGYFKTPEYCECCALGATSGGLPTKLQGGYNVLRRRMYNLTPAVTGYNPIDDPET